jgi:hypothetical protein
MMHVIPKKLKINPTEFPEPKRAAFLIIRANAFHELLQKLSEVKAI